MANKVLKDTKNLYERIKKSERMKGQSNVVPFAKGLLQQLNKVDEDKLTNREKLDLKDRIHTLTDFIDKHG